VQRGRGAVGEDGAGAAGQDGGHEAPVAGEELGRGESVNGAVDAVQTPGGGTLADGGGAQADRAQLIQRERTTLPGGESRELGI